MSEKTYRVKEVFWSIQGEGYWTGHPAVFVRLAGCNLWDGIEDHRADCSVRHQASCPLWCDTDFRGGESLTVGEIVERVKATSRSKSDILVVTGGEPLLQLDIALARGFRAVARLHVETNGTIVPGEVLACIDWLTVSPKTSLGHGLALVAAHEIKLVIDANDSDPARGLVIPEHARLYVQPADVSGKLEANTRAAIEYVATHEGFVLSVQVHKTIGLR